jgi:hypothetical protein
VPAELIDVISPDRHVHTELPGIRSRRFPVRLEKRLCAACISLSSPDVKICKEFYNLPRLIVSHEGIDGKAERTTCTAFMARNGEVIGMADFDALVETYERSAVELPFREHLEHYSICAAVGDVTGLRALDLGCGSGLYTRRLAAWGASRVVGVDVSDGMLETARAQEPSQPQVEYLRRDAARPSPHGDPLLDGVILEAEAP